MWNSIAVVRGKKQGTGQVDIEEGPIGAALDHAKEGKKERDEKNDCQQTHLPICLNYPSARAAKPSRYFASPSGTHNLALIRSDP
jgi:hypothetical protein